MKTAKKVFFTNYKNNPNQETTWVKRNYVKTIWFLVVFAVVIYAFTLVDYRLNTNGWELFTENLQDFLQFSNYDETFPSQSILENSLSFMWQTIQYTILGTFSGFAFSLLTVVGTSKRLFSKLFTFFADLVFIFLRSLPVLIVILAIQKGFDGSFAASLILFWFSWLWSSKYLQDIFENTSLLLFDNYLKKGYAKPLAFYKGVISPNLNKIVMTFFFSLEANIRFSAILGSFSLPGIGVLVDSGFENNNYENLAIPVLTIIITIFLFELFVFVFNKTILQEKTPKAPKNQKKTTKTHFNFRGTVKTLTLLFFVGFSVYEVFQMRFDKVLWESCWSYVLDIFHPDVSLWANDISSNPWFLTLELLLNGIVIIVLSCFFALIFSFFCCSKITSSYVVLPFRTLNIFFRSVPVYIIFIFVNPLFFDATLIGIIAICFETTSILVKQFSESLDAVKTSKIQTYRQMGKSLVWVFVFCMVWDVKNDLYKYSYFAYNNALRTLVILGIFGVSEIGATINGYEQRNLNFQIGAYVVPLVLLLFSIEFIPVGLSYLQELKKFLKKAGFQKVS